MINGWVLRPHGDMRRAYLTHADLRHADLECADLEGADLEGADLTDANLARANLTDANLRNADLRHGDMRRAYLMHADLRRANLAGAKLPYPIIEVGPIGSRHAYLVYQVGIDEVRAGCLLGTLDEFAEAVEKEHGDNEHGRAYRIVITMLRAMREEWTGLPREPGPPSRD